jgi:hypothetical protein
MVITAYLHGGRGIYGFGVVIIEILTLLIPSLFRWRVALDIYIIPMTVFTSTIVTEAPLTFLRFVTSKTASALSIMIFYMARDEYQCVVYTSTYQRVDFAIK